MNNAESTAWGLYNWLKANQPFNGTIPQMASVLGVPIHYVNNALSWARHPDNVAANGWTIPKQPRGDSPNKDWRIYDVADGPVTIEERHSSSASDQRVSEEVIHVIAGLIAMLDIMWQKCDHRSTYGKNISNARRALDGASAMIEGHAPLA